MGYIILTDEMLLRLLQTSDEKAYETIFNRHWRGMYQIAYGKTRDAYVAEEILQQIFLSLWERRESLQVKNLSAYLHQSVRYQCIHFFEKKYSTDDECKLHLATSDYKSDNTLLRADLQSAMDKALNQLPTKTRTVFTLSRFEKYSVREIALHLGLSEKAVEYHVTQALRTMRLKLKEYILLCICIGYQWFV